jgi:hypothetical protein
LAAARAERLKRLEEEAAAAKFEEDKRRFESGLNDISDIKRALAVLLEQRGIKHDWGQPVSAAEREPSQSSAPATAPAVEATRAKAGYDAMENRAIAAGQPIVDTRPSPPKYWSVRVGKRGPDGGVRELRIVPGPSE